MEVQRDVVGSLLLGPWCHSKVASPASIALSWAAPFSFSHSPSLHMGHCAAAFYDDGRWLAGVPASALVTLDPAVWLSPTQPPRRRQSAMLQQCCRILHAHRMVVRCAVRASSRAH